MIFGTFVAGVCVGAIIGGWLCREFGPMPNFSMCCYAAGAVIAASAAYYS